LNNRYFIAGNIWLVLAVVLLVGRNVVSHEVFVLQRGRVAIALHIQSDRPGRGRAGNPDALVGPERGEGIAGSQWKRRVIL